MTEKPIVHVHSQAALRRRLIIGESQVRVKSPPVWPHQISPGRNLVPLLTGEGEARTSVQEKRSHHILFTVRVARPRSSCFLRPPSRPPDAHVPQAVLCVYMCAKFMSHVCRWVRGPVNPHCIFVESRPADMLTLSFRFLVYL